MALRVGYEKLTRETGWKPQVSLGGGRAADDRAGTRRTASAGSAASTGCRPARHGRRATPMRASLVTGGGGLPRLAPRRAARGGRRTTSFVAAARRLRPDAMDDAARLFADARARARLPPRRRGRRHRRQPREPGPLLVREPDDGRARVRAGAPARTSEARRRRARSAPTRSSRRCRSTRTTSGTATRRRRTRPTASRRRRCSSARQAYREQYGLNASSSCRSNLYGPRDNFDLETSHVIPALIRKMVEAHASEVVLWGDGSPTREFLYVDDCAEGLVSRPSATTAPSRSTSAPARRSRSGPRRARSPS